MRFLVIISLVLMCGTCWAGTTEENELALEVVNVLNQCEKGIVSVGSRLDSWVNWLDVIENDPAKLQMLTNGLPSDITIQQINTRKNKLETAVTWIKNNFPQ